MKKTLLIAAAALAAGVISTQAQPVYSQNIVGYVNIATPTNGANYLLSIPFKIGVSNGANEVFSVNNAGVTPTLPDYTALQAWSPAANAYTLYYADSTSPTLWDDDNFSPTPAPVIPVGQGFFLTPSASDVTNTFVGSIAISTGTSNVMSFPTSGANYLVGSVVPYAGSLTNGTASGGGINLNGLPDYSAVQTWNPAANAYTLYYSDSTSPTLWDDNNFSPIPAPILNVGDAFFLTPSGSATWTNGLSGQ